MKPTVSPGYDLVVLAGKTGSSSALAASFNKIVGKVPVLSTKAFWYAKTSPAGTNGGNPGTAGTPSLSIDRVDLYAEHDIFAGIDGNNIGVFNASDAITTGRYMQSNGNSPIIHLHRPLSQLSAGKMPLPRLGSMVKAL